MSGQAWFTLAVVALVLIGLLRNLGPPDMLVWGGAVVVVLGGVIRPDQALIGFANHGMLTVGALFVVAAGLRETGALDRVTGSLFGRTRSERTAVARMAPQVAGLSAFLNNTAVVAMLVSVVCDWCRKQRIPPSRLLIPLSYLSILGGMCTLIGTSTNLVVSGLMGEENLEQLSLFELAWVGVPSALIGSAYLILFSRRLLPDRRDLLEHFGESPREYLVDLRVEPNCPLVGQSVQAAGLRRLPGLFLIEITRADRVIAPVGPDETLLADDRLTFTGVVSTIIDLERIPGLTPAADEGFETRAAQRRLRRFCEAVISPTSPLIGKNIREANFRALYNAAVVAVHRGRERVGGRIGDIVLRAGDTLLLQAGAHFVDANRNNPDFYLVSSFDQARPVRHERAGLALVLLGLLIALMLFGGDKVPIVVAAFTVAGLMIVTRCISAADARRAVHWDVLLTIAGAFALGRALDASGAADALAGGIVALTGGWGPTATLAAVYGVTMFSSIVITANATAVLMFPLALAVAAQIGVDPRPFAICVASAAAASLASPFAYQTNMLVYGPGGYRFSDYLRAGLPLNLLLWIVAVLVIPLIWPLT